MVHGTCSSMFKSFCQVFKCRFLFMGLGITLTSLVYIVFVYYIRKKNPKLLAFWMLTWHTEHYKNKLC